MKTTYIITVEHKSTLPADMADLIGGRIYAMQAIDQQAGGVTVQSPNDWLKYIVITAVNTEHL